MTKEEVQKNSEHWYNKYKDAEKQIATLEGCLLAEQEHTQMLEQQIEKMKFWHNKTEMEVVRDVLTEYINNHESFDIAIFNVRNRLNGRLKNDRRRIL